MISQNVEKRSELLQYLREVEADLVMLSFSNYVPINSALYAYMHSASFMLREASFILQQLILKEGDMKLNLDEQR